MVDEAALTSIYPTIGEEGFARFVSAFYRRVPADDILGPMYPPHDFAEAERHLRDFLVGRLGGPQRYIQERGHPRLRMRHAPFPITVEARNRWLELMTAAITEAELPPEVAAIMQPFFADTAMMLVNMFENRTPAVVKLPHAP